MPVTPIGKPHEVPEHVQGHLDEIHKTADAIEAALKSGNTKLATELKAKVKELFNNAPEEAKSLGLIGSGGKAPALPAGVPHDLPESLKQINDELQETAAAYNKAVQDGDHESATKLRAKLNDLRQKAKAESKNNGRFNFGDVFQLWIEIHNWAPNVLCNAGGWDKEHGWWESHAVGNIQPGDVAYIQMGGGLAGIYCTAYFAYYDYPKNSGSFTWYNYVDSNVCNVWGGIDDDAWDGWHTTSGHTVRFYVDQK